MITKCGDRHKLLSTALYSCFLILRQAHIKIFLILRQAHIKMNLELPRLYELSFLVLLKNYFLIKESLTQFLISFLHHI